MSSQSGGIGVGDGLAEGEAVGLAVGEALGEAVGEGLTVAPFLRPDTIKTSTLCVEEVLTSTSL